MDQHIYIWKLLSIQDQMCWIHFNFFYSLDPHSLAFAFEGIGSVEKMIPFSLAQTSHMLSMSWAPILFAFWTNQYNVISKKY